MKTVDYDGEVLIIKFFVPSADFTPTLTLVKECTGRVFDPVGKKWTALPTQENIDHLVGAGFAPSDAVKNLWHNRPVYEKDATVLLEIDESKLDPALFPYQIEGVRWLETHKGIGIVGLPVGLGKSNIATSYARLHPEDRPILVVCPACVKYNWQREIKRWAGEEAIVLSGKTPERINKHHKWVIINYDILQGWIDVLADFKFKYLIGDESAYVNNPKALRTKSFVALARTVPKRVLLSATPIRNRPSEFFTSLNLVDKKIFPNRYKFLHRYCNPTYNGFSWVYKGLTNDEELFSLVSKVMYRRKKEDVLKDLPTRHKIIVPFQLDSTTQKQYDKASEGFKSWVATTVYKAQQTAQAHIETLRQLAYIGKRNGVIEWISSFLDSGEKLVVFAWHTDAINDIHEAFKDTSVVVDGKVSSRDKQSRIDSFQNDPAVNLFIGQIRAAGVGITLTAASSLAIVEFPWTPGDLEQAMGRIDRIGQESDTVTFYYLVGANTVDEDTAMLLDEKSKMLDKTLDGEIQGDIFGKNIVDMLVELNEGGNNG